jgi:hypothetical protein
MDAKPHPFYCIGVFQTVLAILLANIFLLANIALF